jgi:hypothetical protein
MLVELWALLDPIAVAPAWAIFAILVTGVGVVMNLPGLRAQGHLIAATALGRLLIANADATAQALGLSQRLLTMSGVSAAHYYEWWRQQRLRNRLREWERHLYRGYAYTGAGLITLLLYLELQPPFVEVGWTMLALLLLGAGRLRDQLDFRYQSYLLAAVTFVRALQAEFSTAPVFAGAAHRVAIGVVVTALLFAGQLLVPRIEEKAGPERWARLLYSLLSTAFATALVYREVSGSMLTVWWGLEGAALLRVGFLLRDRTLRLSGLALFLVCLVKLFVYDLRELETLYRILSFFVLGVILGCLLALYAISGSDTKVYLG